MVMIDFDLNILFDRISRMTSIPVEKVWEERNRDIVSVETGRMSSQDYFKKKARAWSLDWDYNQWLSAWAEIYWTNEKGRSLFLSLKKQGYPVCIVSNLAEFNKLALELKNPGFFEASTRNFLSYELGLLKPDLKIYQAVCRALGVQPEQCTFIDDLAENIAGAQAAGMKAVHFRQDNFSEVVREIEKIKSVSR